MSSIQVPNCFSLLTRPLRIVALLTITILATLIAHAPRAKAEEIQVVVTTVKADGSTEIRTTQSSQVDVTMSVTLVTSTAAFVSSASPATHTVVYVEKNGRSEALMYWRVTDARKLTPSTSILPRLDGMTEALQPLANVLYGEAKNDAVSWGTEIAARWVCPDNASESKRMKSTCEVINKGDVSSPTDLESLTQAAQSDIEKWIYNLITDPRYAGTYKRIRSEDIAKVTEVLNSNILKDETEILSVGDYTVHLWTDIAAAKLVSSFSRPVTSYEVASPTNIDRLVKLLSIYEAIRTHQYVAALALVQKLAQLTTQLVPELDAGMKDEAFRALMIVATLAEGKGLEAALEAGMRGRPTWRDKRNQWMLSVGSLVGVQGGRKYQDWRIFSGTAYWYFRAVALVGLDVTWPHCATWGIFASVLDLGTLLPITDFSKEGFEDSVDAYDIFVPGIAIHFGIGNSPFVFISGVSLRDATHDKHENWTPHASLDFGVAVDVPMFRLAPW